MSELRSALGTRPGWWSVIGGIGLAMLGHGLAIATMWIPAAFYGAASSDVDLDAGGRFAVLYAMLCTYAVAQMLLLGSVLISSAYSGQRFKLGLTAGWAGGFALILGTVVVWVVFGGS